MTDEPANLPKKEENKTASFISQANEVVDRYEKANKHMEDMMKLQEAREVEKTLGGETVIAKPEEKEETPEEYSKRVLKNDLE